MLNENFILLGALLSFYGGLSYVIDTIKGKTKPNRISWFLWFLAPAIAFMAELDKGVGMTSILTFMVGFNPLMVFLASFVNPKSYWQTSKTDYLLGAISLLAIVAWHLTGEGNLAILLALIADALASIPTMIKSYREPSSESPQIFLFGMINSGITLLTITDWTFAHYGFPVYIFLICALIYSLIKWQWGVKVSLRAKAHV